MLRINLGAWARGLFCALMFAGAAAAQVPAVPVASPQLVARDYFDGSGGAPRAQALRIARLEVETSIVGATAQTTVTARFNNPTSRPLEGEFTLDLPLGSVVNGYALDINGQMVDGVITPRRQALKAYEARVRRGIDPGVAEVSRANVFRTRVFPIFPRSGRTVRLSFATPVDAGAPFNLPLVTSELVEELVVRVRTEGAGTPSVQGPGALRLTRSSAGAWEGRATNLRLSGALQVGPVAVPAAATVSRHPGGDFFIDIADAAPRTGAEAGPVRRLRVYWDRSRSRRDDDHEAELRLLGRYLAAARPGVVDLITFSEGGPEVRSFTRPAAGDLDAALRPLEYAGATSLRSVFTTALPAADACLLFSDGTVSLDAYRVEPLPCPVLAVSTAPDADRAFLTALSSASGGEHIDLARHPPRSGPGPASGAGRPRHGRRGRRGSDLQPAILPAGPGRFRLVARAPDDGGGVTVGFADGSRRTYSGASTGARLHPAPGALWASARLGVLNATDRPDTAALLRTARRFGVTASGLAYVVLETPYDYAQAEIEPPASLGTDARNAYRRIAADLAQQKQREREGRLQRVVDAWNVHKRWWADPMAARRLDEQRATYESRFPPPPPPVPLMAPPPTVVPQAVMAPPPPIQPRASAPAPDGPLPEEAVQDVVVTGARVGRDSVIADSAAAGPQATTTTATAPDPSRPYLRALEAAPSDRLAAVLREQERRHGDTPAFYFDCRRMAARAAGGRTRRGSTSPMRSSCRPPTSAPWRSSPTAWPSTAITTARSGLRSGRSACCPTCRRHGETWRSP
jgi:hypothetical protein